MPVFISTQHLVAGTKRETYSDGGPKGQKGFTLRTTPNGVFAFYYQHLNKKTGKRDWHLIGTHPEWTPARARTEATRLAGLVASDKSIKVERAAKLARDRAEGTSLQKLVDQYIAYCKQPVMRRYGMEPRKATWRDIGYCFKRPLEWWGDWVVSEITSSDLKQLYDSIVADGYPAQANNVRKQLRVMFNWAMHDDRKYLAVNPIKPLGEDDRAVERYETEDGRVLTADELRKFWHGLDDPDCPGDRLHRLALKLSLVTLLRTGECLLINRDGITPASVTIPLAGLKSRKSKKARDVVQPLNSLAREIIGEVFTIGSAERHLAFPGRGGKTPLDQKRLGALMRGDQMDMGLCEFLGLVDVTPHDLRRTGACILEQLGYDDALIGKVMTHKATSKDAAPVTRRHYLVPVQIIARPVDTRVKALDDLDAALREILGLGAPALLPEPTRLLTAA